MTGSTPSKDNEDYYGGHIPFFKPTDLEQGVNTIDASDSLTEIGFSVSRRLPEQSILVTCIGATIGKTGLIQRKGACNQQINAVITNESIIPKYLYYVCISGYMQGEIKGRASATTLPILNKNKFSEIPIPIPPILEQNRIVAEVDNLLMLVDEMDLCSENLSNYISLTKSKILDLAIHGKLTPQNPADEPASELFKRINPKAVISCDNPQYQNNHFEIPDSWQWCLINDLFEITMGQSPEGETYNNTHGIEFHQGKIHFSERYLDKSDVFTTKPTKIAKAGSILMCVRAPVGIINITQRDICIGRGLCALKCKDVIEPNYAFYALQTIQSELESKATGSTFKAISCSIIRNEFLPLPPYEEQTRIVAKIQELNECICSILNQIEA